MVQPSPSNLDDQQLPQEIGVCQELNTGSSNEGTMQGASAGRDSNQIHGDNNTIIQNVFTLNEELTKPWGVFKKSSAVSVESTKEKVSGIWQHLKVMTSLGFIFLLGTTTFFGSQIRDSIGLGQSSCFNLARKEGKLAIAVANFSSLGQNKTNNLFTETRLKERLEAQMIPNVTVCPIKQSVSSRDRAKILGNNLGAAIIIWGRLDTSALEVYVTTVKIDVRSLRYLPIPTANASDSELQTKNLPGLVNVMTAFAISQIYKSDGRILDGRNTLETALMKVEQMPINLDNQTTVDFLAGAYYFLGQMYNPTKDWQCYERKKDCYQALRAYNKAAEIDHNNYEYLVSQGLLYERLKNLDEAVKIYTQIIEVAPESPSGLEVRPYRADIYLKQSRAREAVEDLKFLCQRRMGDPECFHNLGLAQLQANQIIAAQKTYQDIKSFLSNNAEKAEIINDLESLAQRRSDLLPAINSIIATFNL
ncbi:hypothetical protein QUB08_22345 [Microcoleus sp. BR0-C5]|uniref:tetratricopeptide repeat protein n=1 Tax=Microcoleus sp. BR0-C5 TaxID=2818713 RepID=UPI002FD0BC63